MSDAMTHREIEDVLTSIRRLVAQEGGRGAEAGRLILTEAQRVTAARPAVEAAGVSDDDAPVQTGDESQVAIPAPDFGKLEATIAELEAAVSGKGEYEGEGPQDGPRVSNVTELYGRLSFAHRAPGTDAVGIAQTSPLAEPDAPDAPTETDPETDNATEVATDAGTDTATGPETGATLVAEEAAYLEAAPNDVEPQEPQAAPEAEAGDDDDETVLDEETLRQLIAQIVRDELHGQLGERITLQVRKLVRAEIAKALDERSYL